MAPIEARLPGNLVTSQKSAHVFGQQSFVRGKFCGVVLHHHRPLIVGTA